MKTILFFMAFLFMFLTLVACATGIFFMAGGGDLNRKYGTKLMSARVYLQAISIALILAAFSV